jgi:hypothetical protein
MQTLWRISVLMLAFPFLLLAQEAPPADARTLGAILERMNALEKRVQDLEQQNRALVEERNRTVVATAPAVTQSTPSAQTMPGEHEHGAPIGDMPANPEAYPNLKVRGFANVDFAAQDNTALTNGFNLGQFVLHFTSALSPKVSFFGELSFTAHPTGYTLDVERSIIRYDANDYLKVSFGRYHTPINYWNTAFHHGAWLQTTISRPEMVQFGGRFLPIHFVGAQAEGAIPSGPLGLHYNLGVGNGRETISLLNRNGDAGDVNSNRAWIANLYARPARLYGLQVGGAVYQDLISPDIPSPSKFAERIVSAHLVWTKESPEFLAEFSNVNHRDTLTNREWNSQGTYAQVAYRLAGAARKWKPYYRFEYIHAPQTEPVLQVQNLLGGHTVGTRFDISDFAAFKFEYRSFKRSDTQRTNAFFAQTAFTF